jgi:hypothetical protein
MTPEQLAINQQRIVLAEQQEKAYRIELFNHAHIATAAAVFAVLLDKWFIRNSKPHDTIFPKPTANDLRWLAKMAYHYAVYLPDAAKLCRVGDDKLDVLSGIMQDDAFSFDHLFSVKDRSVKDIAETTQT